MSTVPHAVPPQGTFGASAGSGSAPTAQPPGQTSGAAGGAGAWKDNQKITALWAINEDKNVWVYVAGVGWLKLANNSESAIIALTILAACAKQMGSNVSYGTDDTSGQITQMYVW
jgi:hypothetical protein